LTALGAATVAITELLSAFRWITPAAVAAAWCVVLPLLALCQPLRFPITRPRPDWFVIAAMAAITVLAILIGCTAILSPPNSADTMSYHLPRVIHWMQNGTVAFFPTSYLNLIMLQPAAEYLMLHAYLLTGTDAGSNLFSFTAYIGCVLAVSCLAGLLGGNTRTQAIAAVFCATLPNAILQASGSKNDLILACFLCSAAVFAARWNETQQRTDLMFLALATGMAFGTKATAYLFCPPLLLAIVPSRYWLRTGVAVAAGVLAINGPQYVRNLDLSGSPLGFDSAHADGVFRWRVEQFGWRPTVSNLLRNTSEQLGARSETWNQQVFRTVAGIHRSLGIDPQDPTTTWRWAEFRPPKNANHEADANNRWHLLLFLFALPLCRYRWAWYAAAVTGGFLLFCFYLKWQPYFSRVLVPVFILMSPVAGMMIARLPVPALQVVLCAVLLSNARLAATQNWTRPLTGPKSLLQMSRNEAYFNDIGQWSNRESYLRSVDAMAATQCPLVGIDTSRNHVQYPFMILLRQRLPAVRFVETDVRNPSEKYAHRVPSKPCAVFCPDCEGDNEKIARYQLRYREALPFGRFLIFAGAREER
jgi:hypothetical protein